MEKSKRGKVVQRSVPKERIRVVTIGSDGSIVSNTVFDDQHQWVHNYYYMDDNLLTPYIMIEPAEHENALYFLEYDKRAVNTRNRNCMLAQLPQVTQYKVW
ncbi:MAG: hypothetical protein ACLSCV_01200 [Acutalibacteraceae bacterium]